MVAFKYINAKNPYFHNIITLAVVLFSSSSVIANKTRTESIENKTESIENKTESIENKTTAWSFQDFLKNFEPKAARSRFRNGRRTIGTNEEYINAMFEGIDSTDALLKLDLESIDVAPQKNNTRRYAPEHKKNLMEIQSYSGISGNIEDPFHYRKRLFELMKQAIYQARTEMPVWQNLRKKHREHKLYKMGFLMSKTDNAVKIFSQFIFRSYKLCNLVTFHNIDRMHFFEVLLLHERALSLWFNTQLLTDLVLRNDRSCRNTSANHKDYLLEHWKFFN